MSWRDERKQLPREMHAQAFDETHQKDFKDEDGLFDPSRWKGEIDTLITEIVKHDPHGGCWEWVKTNLTEKWRRLRISMNDIDKAFQDQHGSNLLQTIADTRRLYHECISAWFAVSMRESSNE